jgi:hypothetical protein
MLSIEMVRIPSFSAWSTANYNNNFFRLGLFTGHGYVNGGVFSLEGYLW